MRLGILKAGGPPESLAHLGSYPDMIRRHLGESRYRYVEYDVPEGQLPPQADACPAYVITGSRAGVYDPLPWIADLKAFLVGVGGKARLLGSASVTKSWPKRSAEKSRNHPKAGDWAR